MTATAVRRTPCDAGRPAAGDILFDGSAYDRQLRRCRIYAIADGDGGMEWRVVRTPFDADADEAGVERCFRSYAQVLRWLA